MKSPIVAGRARLAMARAIETTEQSALAVRSVVPARIPVRARKRLIEADLPRVCAVHDRGYISRYISDAKGCFHYAQSFRYKGQLNDQYEDKQDAKVSSDQLADETCPWCGAVGRGSVRCGTCKGFVCYGRTTADRHFTCRDSCTGAGQLVTKKRDAEGLTPGARPAGPSET